MIMIILLKLYNCIYLIYILNLGAVEIRYFQLILFCGFSLNLYLSKSRNQEKKPKFCPSHFSERHSHRGFPGIGKLIQAFQFSEVCNKKIIFWKIFHFNIFFVKYLHHKMYSDFFKYMYNIKDVLLPHTANMIRLLMSNSNWHMNFY